VLACFPVTRLRILFVVSECVPLVKTGGLGDVAGALPSALRARGHDVRVLMPRYRAVSDVPTKKHPSPLGVPTGAGERWCAVHEATLDSGVPIYLLEHDVLYDRDGIYGDANGDYSDNVLRYALLSRAALLLPQHLDWPVDVFHAHDWQASLVNVYARWLKHPEPTVLTIHNLGYQGRYGGAGVDAIGLSVDAIASLGLECFGDVNLLQGGIRCATKVSTVSPRYAGEIQTPEGGAGLDAGLRARADDLVGILNGIDEVYWNPRTDPLLPANYCPDDLSGKVACKAALQRELGLLPRADVPLVGLVSRFAEQKGIDIFAEALNYLLPFDLQFAVLGSGDQWAHDLFAHLSETTHNFRVGLGYNEPLAHLIEAGADLFVMPSRYEPCGLNQLYSQRYGTLPVVRAVGGLADTVDHELTGFVFEHLSGQALAEAIAHAADTYRQRPEHFSNMQRTAMHKRMGWDQAASQYEALYRMALSSMRSTMSP
jgi:starch synthase